MSAGTAAMLKLLAMLPAPARAQMVAMYRDGLRSQLEAVAPVLAGDAPLNDTVKPLVHKLAGSAAMMQDTDLSTPAREVEKALVAGDLETARALWPEVLEAADATLAALSSF